MVAVFVAGLLGAAAAAPGALVADVRAAAPEQVNPDGLHLVGPAVLQPQPADEEQAQAISDAQELAFKYPDDFAFPWLEPDGTVELAVVTPNGADIALEFINKGGGRFVTRPAAISLTALIKIQDDLTRLSAQQLADVDHVYRTEPDALNNRIIITVDEITPELSKGLVGLYGDLVAVRPTGRPNFASLASRRNDLSPFHGGAEIEPTGMQFCSDAFSWQVSSGDAMLMAAHCISSGGSVSAPNQSMGTVTSGSEENWQVGVGTVAYSGRSCCEGDVALIRLNSNRQSAAFVYRGTAETGYLTGVSDMFHRYAQVYDQFCTSGRTTGELCTYTVADTFANQLYLSGEWVRNIVVATNPHAATCVNLGDSGGAVYKVLQIGTVKAQGIISGFEPFLNECTVFITDLYVAYLALPGHLKVT